MWARADYYSSQHQRPRGHNTIGSHLKRIKRFGFFGWRWQSSTDTKSKNKRYVCFGGYDTFYNSLIILQYKNKQQLYNNNISYIWIF